MIVTVRNAKNRKIVSLLKSATHSYASMIMSQQMIRHLNIKIIILDKLYYKANAYCAPDEIANKLRSFEIEIRRAKVDRMLSFLAHEMVHVKQFATNELKSKSVKGEYKTFWQGQICEIDSYWDQPWEIEAHTLEEELFCYLKSINYE